MRRIAPPELAEDWDNVGLLIGDPDDPVDTIRTCLTITSDVVDQVVELPSCVVIAHHPLPFRPVGRLTPDDYAGGMVRRLIRGGVSVYSAHTAYDSASGGINDQWCWRLGMGASEPLEVLGDEPVEGSKAVGRGRKGQLREAIEASELARRCSIRRAARVTGDPNRPVQSVAVACGSGGGLLPLVIQAGCDALVTGEMSYHQCLEARAAGVSVVLTGHFGSERFAMEELAERLSHEFPDLNVAPAHESDVVL